MLLIATGRTFLCYHWGERLWVVRGEVIRGECHCHGYHHYNTLYSSCAKQSETKFINKKKLKNVY